MGDQAAKMGRMFQHQVEGQKAATTFPMSGRKTGKKTLCIIYIDICHNHLYLKFGCCLRSKPSLDLEKLVILFRKYLQYSI